MTAATPALPPLEDVLARTRVVSIPTRTKFRGISTREAALIEGPQGWTEFSPFVEYEDAEAAAWLNAALEFGWSKPPETRRTNIDVNATMPAVDASDVPDILARFPGCNTVKVKVAESGQTFADDLARVRAVREALGPNGKIRLDANGGWQLIEADTAIRSLARFDLDYVEQPCAEIAELAVLRERLGGLVRIAADESVRKASDPLTVARAGAADLLIVKVQPLGGISRALDVIQHAGMPVVVSSALETSVGISMGAHLAAALPDHLIAGASGLGTVALLRGDVVPDSLVPRFGSIPVRRVVPERLLLAQYRASSYRDGWWRERITRCHALLEAAPAR